MPFSAVSTDQAPAAIGPYSQAVRAGDAVYLSGQIGLDPATGELVAATVEEQARQVFDNLRGVAAAAGGSLKAVVKLTVYLADLADYPVVNTVMADYFEEPYPARAAIGVVGLPRGAAVEVDAILSI
jgi:reactive intermediate/imine deaminase